MRSLIGVSAVVLLGIAPPIAVPRPVPTPPPAGGSPKAEAPAAVTWGVSPSSPKGPNGRAAFAYKLDPGARLTDYVAVTNHSARPITLSVYASDAVTTAQGGFDLLPAARRPVDVGSWVSLTSRQLTIPSSSRVDVPFTVNVPANATPGDHVGGVVASLTATTTDAHGNQVAVDHRVGTRIYLRVTGELRPALALEDVRVQHRGSLNPFGGGEVTATATVRNTGNVRLAGTPTVHAAGPLGLTAGSASGGTLPEILPGDAVRTTVRLAQVPPLFRLTVTAAVTPTAVAGQTLDPPPGTVSHQVTVWAVPWSQLLMLALLAGAAWTLVAVRRRRRRAAARDLAHALATAREQGRAEAAVTTAAPTEKPAADMTADALSRGIGRSPDDVPAAPVPTPKVEE
ncbi:WxL protein peptidoglycan domain-containing protein [Micromonospora sp. NPDC047740]|uniref:WxL protein peptidoglycan domain-containing protein n=1 Tax=Micromonospora sp. NPDC047740 TaxID=3364254 RepID=UPI00372278F4